MPRYRGLTWDHPRGRDALERSAAATDALISWDVHSLEGFESAPIDDLAERYDVIVLDHPHLGDALAQGSLRPLSSIFDAAWLESLAHTSVGPSLESYRLDGEIWALPLDAATQVAVADPRRVSSPPATWDEVAELAREQPVALSLGGPHAFLTFASVCVALGKEPRVQPGAEFVSRDTAVRAVELLSGIAVGAPAGTTELNPIGLLDRMRRDRDIAYIPLIYGYVTASTGADGLRFADAPTAVVGGRRGSTIGGTGLAVSRRAVVDDDLRHYLLWHLDPLTQAAFLPDNSGQPSARSAWQNVALNARSNDFYRGTLATIEDAWVRPRVAGFTEFQSAASAVLREVIAGGAAGAGGAGARGAGAAAVASALDRVDRMFDALGEGDGAVPTSLSASVPVPVREDTP